MLAMAGRSQWPSPHCRSAAGAACGRAPTDSAIAHTCSDGSLRTPTCETNNRDGSLRTPTCETHKFANASRGAFVPGHRALERHRFRPSSVHLLLSLFKPTSIVFGKRAFTLSEISWAYSDGLSDGLSDQLSDTGTTV